MMDVAGVDIGHAGGAGAVKDVAVAGAVDRDARRGSPAPLLALEEHAGDLAVAQQRRGTQACSTRCAPLSSTSSCDGQLQLLRIDGRRPGDDAVVRGGALLPIGGGGLVGAAPQAARRAGDRVLRQPVQQVVGDAADHLRCRTSRSCGRSRSPARRWTGRPDGWRAPAARHRRRCARRRWRRRCRTGRRPPPARRSRGTPARRAPVRASCQAGALPARQVALGEDAGLVPQRRCRSCVPRRAGRLPGCAAALRTEERVVELKPGTLPAARQSPACGTRWRIDSGITCATIGSSDWNSLCCDSVATSVTIPAQSAPSFTVNGRQKISSQFFCDSLRLNIGDYRYHFHKPRFPAVCRCNWPSAESA